MLNVAGACGCSIEPAMNVPPSSVPPHISMTGLYPAWAVSQWLSSAEEASPVLAKQRIQLQSMPCTRCNDLGQSDFEFGHFSLDKAEEALTSTSRLDLACTGMITGSLVLYWPF